VWTKSQRRAPAIANLTKSRRSGPMRGTQYYVRAFSNCPTVTEMIAFRRSAARRRRIVTMEMHPITEPRETALRQMTTEQLLHLGERYVVYLKSGVCDGEMLFVLYGANGAPLMAADDVETALDMAAECGLNFVAVH
jgi:hypothetical protein